jgi:hypothetical protein
MNTDPVIVPIQVDLGPAQAGLNQLGQTVNTARSAGTGQTAGGAPPPPGGVGGPADIQTIRTLVRELANLTAGVTALTAAFAQLTQTVQAASAPGAPQTPPGVPPPPGVQPQPQPPQPGPQAQPQPQQQPGPQPGPGGFGQTMAGAQRIGMQLLGAGLSTMGIGWGIGAIVSTLRSWMEQTRELHLDLARATLAGGGGPAAYEQTLGELQGVGPTFVRAPETLRGVQQMRQAGMMGPGAVRAAVTAGELGLTAYGQAGAGMDVLAAGGQVFRTDTTVMEQLLATIVQQGRIANVSDAQMLDQFRALTSLYEQTQGQGVRTREDLQGIVTLQRWLTNLPGRIGEGPAGAQIAGGLASIGQRGPIGQMIALGAYREAHRLPPGWYPTTPAELVDVEVWGQDLQNAPRIAQRLRRDLGPDVAARWFSQQTGAPLRQARELFRQPGDVSEEQIRLLDPARARELAREREREIQEKTIGGQEMLRRSQDELARATSGVGEQLVELEQTIRRLTTELIPRLDRLLDWLERPFAAPTEPGEAPEEPMPPIGTKEWFDWFIRPTQKILKRRANRDITGVPEWLLPDGGGAGTGATLPASGQFGGPVTTQFRQGPGLVSYQPLAEQYGTAGTIEWLGTLGRAWRTRHSGAYLGMGDISLQGGGPFPMVRDPRTGKLRRQHKSHARGVDIDIRPPTRDLRGGPTRIGAANYDPVATQELVDLILKMVPGAIIGFADPNIRGTQKWADHRDHLHVRLPATGVRRARRARDVNVNIHMDPGFPGRVSTEGSPGVKVHTH